MCIRLVYLVEPLILGRPLQDPLHDALQLVDCGGLFGVGEDGRLVTSDHKKHILKREQALMLLYPEIQLRGADTRQNQTLKFFFHFQF